MSPVLYAFLMTTIAGLSTGIGSGIAYFTKQTNMKFLSVSLGFSGGVMIYVSMMEILPEAIESLVLFNGSELQGTIYAVLGFFAGMLLIAVIDRLLPEEQNPHEAWTAGEHCELDPSQESDHRKHHLLRTGFMTALAIAIHNFPEGLAAFVSALQSSEIAIPIVVAISIHNIPEGIAISVPIYCATGSRSKAFLISLLSGLSEPLGGLVGYFFLLPFMNDAVFGILLAAVAGIMVFISLDELIPSARTYGNGHLSIYGVMAGMAVMAGSLILFM